MYACVCLSPPPTATPPALPHHSTTTLTPNPNHKNTPNNPNSPKLAILDEATSALDLALEEKMYRVLAQIPGISYVSVGHRPSLAQFHDSRLTLTGEGYSLDRIEGGGVSGGGGDGVAPSVNGMVV